MKRTLLAALLLLAASQARAQDGQAPAPALPPPEPHAPVPAAQAAPAASVPLPSMADRVARELAAKRAEVDRLVSVGVTTITSLRSALYAATDQIAADRKEIDRLDAERAMAAKKP